MNINAFYKIPYGLYIISSSNNDKLTAHISNTVIQTTSEPKTIAICSNKNNLTTDFIKESKAFSISVLSQNVDMKFIGNFGFKSGRDIDKFINIKYKFGITGAPIVLEKTLAYFDCKLMNYMDLGSHILFIGEIVDMDIENENDSPLTYEYYRNVIKGFTPKDAPTYIDKKEQINEIKKENNMKKYVCIVCGYVYDPEIGDPDFGVSPGTPFEKLPASWVCPVCGVPTDQFEEQA